MSNNAKTLKGYKLDRLELPTLKPTSPLGVFNTRQPEGVAQEVEGTFVKIMREAAAG